MWVNDTLRQAQSNPPWPPGTIVTPEVLAQYADWKQVADDYVLPRLLADEKKKARAEINRQRDAKEAATPFQYLSKDFDYDMVSRERLGKAIQGATLALIGGANPNTVAVEWTLADNSKLPMTLADLAGFPTAEMTRSQGLHNKAGEIKARIDAAETVAAIDAILAEPDLWEGE